MSGAILLTGPPGSGKTTAIRRVVRALEVPAGGFYTEEIREGRRRVGFRIVTLEGREAVMAHVDFGGPQRVSRYGVDVDAIDGLAVESMRQALEAQRLVVIDEIGPMELLSEAFREAVVDALEAPAPVLGTIMRRSTAFTDRVKSRPRVALVEIRREDREGIVDEIVERLNRLLG
jgi:nucleoside-triphosphatase